MSCELKQLKFNKQVNIEDTFLKLIKRPPYLFLEFKLTLNYSPISIMFQIIKYITHKYGKTYDIILIVLLQFVLQIAINKSIT